MQKPNRTSLNSIMKFRKFVDMKNLSLAREIIAGVAITVIAAIIIAYFDINDKFVENNEPQKADNYNHEITDNRFEEYYIIKKNGDLSAYDKNGFINTMHSVKSSTSILEPTSMTQNGQDKPCSRINKVITGEFQGVNLTIEKAECFHKIENKYEKPRNGDLFFSLLIQIHNFSEFKLHGGGSDYHYTFRIITEDGFEIQALNTASTAWKENRRVWNADIIDIGDKRKGWIVFSFPEKSLPTKLVFHVDRYDKPHHYTKMGILKITL